MARPRFEMPWWIPAAWVGASLAVFPRQPWMAMVGYHGCCALGWWGAAWRPRWGRIPPRARPVLILAAVLALAAGLLPRLPWIPLRTARTLVGHWPGGWPSHAAYLLLVNVPLEEGYWRGWLQDSKPWPALGLGLAFALHHVLAAGLGAGWAWALPAGLATAAAGLVFQWARREGQGLAYPILVHGVADLAILAFTWGQLRG